VSEQISITDAKPTTDTPSVMDEANEGAAGPSAESVGADVAASGTGSNVKQTAVLVGTVFKEVLQVVMPAILLALAIHIFLAQATVVYGQSMQPNLQPAERLVIEKVSYYFDEPQRNDIVVLDIPQMSDLLIKRVVGLPGESVEIRRGTVLIDGQAIDQSFIYPPGGGTYGPITLGMDSYFVMGDNRNNSNDSRIFGPVGRSTIAGKAWLCYWPLNRFTFFD